MTHLHNQKPTLPPTRATRLLDTHSNRILRGEIDAVTDGIGKCFEYLPLEVQARVTILQNSLGTLRLRTIRREILGDYP